MMILAMLEEGKITSEEAIKLMEALEAEESFLSEKDRDSRKENYKDEEKFNFKDTLNSLEDLGSDIGNALSSVFDGLKDFSSSFVKHNYDTITSHLEMDLAGLENPSLDLRSVNGDINLKASKDHSLSIDVTCQYKKGLLVANEPYFDFVNMDGKISFSPKYNSNISIKLDVSLPEKHYDEIKLNTSNGKIYALGLNAASVECLTSNSSIEFDGGNIDLLDLTTKNGKIAVRDLNAKDLKTYTTNSSIELRDLQSEKIVSRTGNGKILCNNIKSMDVICKTSNSIIDIKTIDSPAISLATSNGKILLKGVTTENARDINLVTSNGSIVSEIEGTTKDTIFDLETSMGSIELDFPALIYITNKQINLGLKKIVAHTVDYDIGKDHLNFVASTSNGSIKIN